MDLLAIRRSSIDSTITTTPLHPIDPAVLDNIHASSAASPSLTTFSLGSPPARKVSTSEAAGFNRIYTIVKGVVDNVKEVVGPTAKNSLDGLDEGTNGGLKSTPSSLSQSILSIDSSQNSSPTKPTKPSSAKSLYPTLQIRSDEFTNTAKIVGQEPPYTNSVPKGSNVTSQEYYTLERSNSGVAQIKSSSRHQTELRPNHTIDEMGEDEVDTHASRGKFPPESSQRKNLSSGTTSPDISFNRPHNVHGLSSSNLPYIEKETNKYTRRGSINTRPDSIKSSILGDGDFDGLQDDEDAGSEILTDEEEAVAGKGGYLGKVAGMGNLSSDDKQNLPANLTSRTLAGPRSRRSSSTRTQPSLVSSTSGLVGKASRNGSLLEKQHTLSDQSDAATYDNMMLSPRSTEPTRLRSESFSMISPESASQNADFFKGSVPNMPTTSKDYFERMSALNNDSSLNLPALAQLRHASSTSSVGTSIPTQSLPGHRSEVSLDGGHGSGFGSASRDKVAGPNAANSQAKVGAALRQLRRGEGLTKDFWMKDENCKECFLCGRSFTAWRRKHHCRTCGQIFCSSCTTQIAGEKFGYIGNMRVCNSPCLGIVNDFRDEGSISDLSDGSDFDPRPKNSNTQRVSSDDRAFNMPKDHRPTSTPLMAIPATRTNPSKNGRLRKPILEFDAADKVISSRPGSARSMNKPMGGGSRSSTRFSNQHNHHHHQSQSQSQSTTTSRHQHTRSGRWSSIFSQTSQPNITEEQVPFQRREHEGTYGSAFQKDSIIDPELAPYMSDEDADDDGSMGIFATIAPKYQPVDEDMVNKQTNDESPSSKRIEGRDDVLSDNRSVPSKHSSNLVPSLSSSGLVNLVSEGAPVSGRRRRNLSLVTGSQRSPRKTPRATVRNIDPLGLPSSSFMPPGGHLPKLSSRSMSMRGPHAPPIEVNAASLKHASRLLRQLLMDDNISDVDLWENALLPILLRCTDDLNPDVRGGDVMDLRHFVKVKRIPGSRPGDTSYVSGVVFSKNLALKGMPRQIVNPRIAILAFPLEYHRQQSHFMSLEPVIAQEKEYLQNMVNRIISLRPTLLLVEKNVSRLALDHLYNAGVATAVMVKPSVIEAVARCAQADIIFSAEETALKPHRIGRSASIDIKTYVHPDILTPNHKKTYMYISGCQKELGCTIVLRGGDMHTLAKLKRITEFMVYVVYNLKLETCLMRDQYAAIPASIAGGSLEKSETINIDGAYHCRSKSKSNSSELEKKKKKELSRIQELLEVSTELMAAPQTNAIKADATTNKVKQEFDSQLEASEIAHEEKTWQLTDRPEVTTPEEYPSDLPTPNYYGSYIKEHENKILSASPFVKFAQPYLLVRARNYERRLEYLKRLKDQPTDIPDDEDDEKEKHFQLISPEMLQGKAPGKTKKMRELLKAAHQAEYEKALYVYQSQKKQWENYLAQKENLFDPMEHHRIVTLYSMVSTSTSVPCRGPEMIMFEYYNDQYYNEDEFREKDYYREPDCTLGQYVQDLYRTRDQICDSGCEKRMIDHHRSYVHGHGRLSVHVEKFLCPVPNMQHQVLMWSYCKICKIVTPCLPMSESTWKYSFGKYLELSYWSTRISMRGETCPHDIHREHVRYFGYQNFAVRFEYDAIDLMEIIVPRPRMSWKPELDLKMKNEQYTLMHEKINRFWDSVVSRLKSINVESVAAEKLEACKVEIQSLLARAEEDRDWLINKLQEKYTGSKYYEVLPLNRGMRAMQERVAEWDFDFAEFDRKFFPSEKDIRRMATLQLRKLFLDRDSTASSLQVDHDVTPVLEKDHGGKALAEVPVGDVIESSKQIDHTNTAQVLSAVVEEETVSPVTHDKIVVQDSKVDVVDPETIVASQPTIEDMKTPQQNIQSASLAQDAVLEEKSILPSLDNNPLMNEQAVATDIKESISGTTSPSIEGPSKSPLMSPFVDTQELTEESTCSTSPRISSPVLKSSIPVLSKDFARRRTNPPSAVPIHRSTSLNSVTKRLESLGGVGGIAQAMKQSTFAAKSNKRPADLNRSRSADKGKKLDKPKLERSRSKNRDVKPDGAKLPDRIGGVNIALGFKRAGQSQIPIMKGYPDRNSRVSSLAQHFEELSREFQREREHKERSQAAARRSRAFPVVASKPIVEVYKNVEQAVQEVSDEESPSPSPRATTPVIPNESLENSTTTAGTEGSSDEPITEGTVEEVTGEQGNDNKDVIEPQGTDTPIPVPTPADAEGDTSDAEYSLLSDSETSKTLPEVSEVLDASNNEIPLHFKLETEIPKHEKTSLMKILSTFWAERSASGWTSLEYPLHSSDHVFANSDVIVREDEPSSLIAFALDSSDYRLKLEKMRQSVKLTGPDPCDPVHHNHLHIDQNNDDQALQKSLLNDKGTHLKYQFQEGSAKMFCKVFFAEQFDALRRNCSVADRYVESLSRCIKWDSKGGKTKSVFLKTLDDRIVLKQLSQVETTAFLKFAPSYFHIMSEALFHELPTAIAKMLGFYQIFIKNPLTGTEIKWDILVMENLFYDRTMTRTFDLKGSMRNRYVQETGEQNEVLLDENMVEFIYENPLFVREHAKKFLRACLWNDTLFLERNQVMDYSLMIGIDENKKELVIGLIDCVRTYTFDKKLESLIKASGIAGGGRNKPTITSPKEYKRRFREAMERYIFEAPNCWRQPRVTWINAVGIPFARKGTVTTEQIENTGENERE